MKITGRWLHGESISGQILRLDEPLSFWGGLDPSTGEIIDQAHPQAGASMAGAVVAMPGSRGSSGTPGVLGEALRTGAGPAALIVTTAETSGAIDFVPIEFAHIGSTAQCCWSTARRSPR